MNKSFEEKLKELENMVSKLENSDLGLDEACKLYEDAKKLSLELKNELDESLKKMSFIVENGNIVPLTIDNEENKDI